MELFVTWLHNKIWLHIFIIMLCSWCNSGTAFMFVLHRLEVLIPTVYLFSSLIILRFIAWTPWSHYLLIAKSLWLIPNIFADCSLSPAHNSIKGFQIIQRRSFPPLPLPHSPSDMGKYTIIGRRGGVGADVFSRFRSEFCHGRWGLVLPPTHISDDDVI